MGYKKSKKAIQEQMERELDGHSKIYSTIARTGAAVGNKVPISVGHFLLVKIHNKDLAMAEEFESEISETDEKIAYAMIFGKDLEQVEKELDCERERIDKGAVNVLEMLARYDD